mgnify:FL=1
MVPVYDMGLLRAVSWSRGKSKEPWPSLPLFRDHLQPHVIMCFTLNFLIIYAIDAGLKNEWQISKTSCEKV